MAHKEIEQNSNQRLLTQIGGCSISVLLYLDDQRSRQQGNR